MWKKIIGLLDNPWRTVFVPGDDSVAPTRWWNRSLLRRWFWKTAVFEVSSAAAVSGYRVGYWPLGCERTFWIEEEVHHDQRFGMRIGHEGCYFFAVRVDSLEAVPIRCLGVVGREIPTH